MQRQPVKCICTLVKRHGCWYVLIVQYSKLLSELKPIKLTRRRVARLKSLPDKFAKRTARQTEKERTSAEQTIPSLSKRQLRKSFPRNSQLYECQQLENRKVRNLASHDFHCTDFDTQAARFHASVNKPSIILTNLKELTLCAVVNSYN